MAYNLPQYRRVIQTAPAAEPVTLAEVKRQRNIFSTDHDTELTRLITAARQYVERYLNRALISQTWDLYIDAFPTQIIVPLPPLQSITTVKYYDTAGVQQTLSSALYTVVSQTSGPAVITPAVDQSWPDIQTRPNAVEVRFVAGYGAASTAVPEPIRQALFLLIGQWSENTEASLPQSLSEIPFGVRALLDTYRVWYA